MGNAGATGRPSNIIQHFSTLNKNFAVLTLTLHFSVLIQYLLINYLRKRCSRDSKITVYMENRMADRSVVVNGQLNVLGLAKASKHLGMALAPFTSLHVFTNTGYIRVHVDSDMSSW